MFQFSAKPRGAQSGVQIQSKQMFKNKRQINVITAINFVLRKHKKPYHCGVYVSIDIEQKEFCETLYFASNLGFMGEQLHKKWGQPIKDSHSQITGGKYRRRSTKIHYFKCWEAASDWAVELEKNLMQQLKKLAEDNDKFLVEPSNIVQKHTIDI